MKRILSKHALLFVNHGRTQQERETVIGQMVADQSGVQEREGAERSFYVRVEKDVVTDVPDWCAETKTWELGIQDETLVELVQHPKASVPAKIAAAPSGEELGMAEAHGKAKRPRTT